LRAPRANRGFATDEKHIRTKTTVPDKTTRAEACFYPRSPIARGCAFHPCAIDDPRGRAAVRASFITVDRNIALLRPVLV
jgi:hypothetical protein